MFLRILFAYLLISVVLVSCSGGLKKNPDSYLKIAGWDHMPTQEDFPDAGAVVLYENFYSNLYLDSDWEVNVRERVHRVILYLNDKGENWATHSIFLRPKYKLNWFKARTIKPNGDIIKLTEEDLHPSQLNPSFVMFSDDKSLKFSFPGVEPGAILEFSYEVIKAESFYNGDVWFVQEDIPKLYTSFTVELPTIFDRYGIKWTYSPVNFIIDPPKTRDNMLHQTSYKNESRIFKWELKDIAPLKDEPYAPSYYDIAEYVRVDLQYDSWNKLSKRYWKYIKERFKPTNPARFKKLALKIVGTDTNEVDRIRKIFYYVQKKNRYLAMTIGQSGLLPHTPEEILKNAYGDCKDMTVMNVVLLRALGIDAFPALVNTRSAGTRINDIISLDFNHMIAYVKTKDNKEYWLDATGNRCPLGEVPAGIEGQKALVIFDSGKSKFMTIPVSTFRENVVERLVDVRLEPSGYISGHAKLKFKGNYNFSVREELKDANTKDMEKAIAVYLNRNMPGAEIDSLLYDDLDVIDPDFHIDVWFHKDHHASQTGDMLIVKPYLFKVSDQLARFTDKKRIHALMLSQPHQIIDKVTYNFSANRMKLEGLPKPHTYRNRAFVFTARTMSSMPEQFIFSRNFRQNVNKLPARAYSDWLDLQRTITEANNENVVLKLK